MKKGKKRPCIGNDTAVTMTSVTNTFALDGNCTADKAAG